jgi:hypothetical protein
MWALKPVTGIVVNRELATTTDMARPTSFDRAIAQLYRDYLELLGVYGAFGKLVQEAVEDMALRQRLVMRPNKYCWRGAYGCRQTPK